MTTPERFPADPLDSYRIQRSFDEFAQAIAPYQWGADLWEDHLDAVLGVLRQFGHYPPDPDRHACPIERIGECEICATRIP